MNQTESSLLPEPLPPTSEVSPLQSPKASDQPAKPDYHTTVYIVNSIVIPDLRLLLGRVLNAVNATVPNKDQNKAMTHIVRQAFDDAYYDILRQSYPDCNFGQADDAFAVTPATKRSEVFVRDKL